MKVGDLVKMKEEPLLHEEHDIGLILSFKPRGWSRDPDPGCDVWNDAVVFWPDFGIAFHMRAMLEVVNESR
jgi:hypothetical protein